MPHDPPERASFETYACNTDFLLNRSAPVMRPPAIRWAVQLTCQAGRQGANHLHLKDYKSSRTKKLSASQSRDRFCNARVSLGIRSRACVRVHCPNQRRRAPLWTDATCRCQGCDHSVLEQSATRGLRSWETAANL